MNYPGQKRRYDTHLRQWPAEYSPHEESERRSNQKYYWSNPGRWRRWRREYYASHAEECHAYNATRRGARVGPFNKSDWEALLIGYRLRCAYCRKKKRLTRDHVIPVIKGGKHDATNIVPACQSCNARKHIRKYPPHQLVMLDLLKSLEA